MKKNFKKLIFGMLLAFAISVCFAVTSFAANNDSIYYMANESDSNTKISIQTGANGGDYLFLPSSADLTVLKLGFDAEAITVTGENGSVTVAKGASFDLTALFASAKDEYTVTVNADGSQSEITIMKSANIRTLFFVSADPANEGREWVDAVKSNEAEGAMSLVGTDGEVDHTDDVKEIKGRGNTTFTDYSKKPYQIKLNSKAALIEGCPEKNKKWVLLANAADYTLMHNTITFALAQALGMEYTGNYEAVDLYYDGEYRGNYLITEKVEVDSTKVEIDDLDEAVEEANIDNPAYENPVVKTATIASHGETAVADGSNNSYKYVTGLNEPELPMGTSHHAYLLELEFASRYPNEQSGFVSNRGQCVVTKNPEYLTKDTGYFISTFWNEFETAVYSENGYNKATGKYYYDYCDLDSLVNIYLINEYVKNYDSYWSSTFFYLPADSDKMFAGPIWDYDLSYGGAHSDREIGTENPEYFLAASRYLANGLMKIESFRNAVKQALAPTGRFYKAASTLYGENGLIASEAAKLDASQKMNYALWDIFADDYYVYNDVEGYRIVVADGADYTYKNAISFLQNYTQTRLNYLSNATAQWNGADYSTPEVPPKKLTLWEQILQLFQSIIEWFQKLFGIK